MRERLLLHAATDLVEATIRDANHMKRIRDPDRVIQVW